MATAMKLAVQAGRLAVAVEQRALARQLTRGDQAEAAVRAGDYRDQPERFAVGLIAAPEPLWP